MKSRRTIRPIIAIRFEETDLDGNVSVVATGQVSRGSISASLMPDGEHLDSNALAWITHVTARCSGIASDAPPEYDYTLNPEDF